MNAIPYGVMMPFHQLEPMAAVAITIEYRGRGVPSTTTVFTFGHTASTVTAECEQPSIAVATSTIRFGQVQPVVERGSSNI